MIKTSRKINIFFRNQIKTFVFLHVLSLIFISNIAKAQDRLEGFFSSPVKYNYVLSGNFGEVRPNHFHSGIDIRTYYIGKPLYAPADGYVSRIKISSGGYGNALYITHPNGYMTVYGHMDKFRDDIQNYIRNLQIETESFQLVVYPDSGLFPVKKGEYIGDAGNSGRSFGPHLHFEIRESRKDIPVNPLLYGMKVKDSVKPKISAFAIYDIDTEGALHGKKIYNLNFTSSVYTYPTTVLLSGRTGIAIRATDFMDGTASTQGVYSIDLQLDNVPVFNSHADKISFYETRYVNSFMDYAEKRNKRKAYLKCFIEPGNYLSIYDTAKTKNAGIIQLHDSKKHKLTLIVKDAAGNKRTLNIFIKKNRPTVDYYKCEHKMYYDSANFYVEKDIRLYFPKGCFYTNICFNLSELKSDYKLYSPVYQIGSPEIPIHKKAVLSISAKRIPENLRHKAVIVKRNGRGYYKSVGGKEINGFISAKIRTFGIYALALDTKSPKILPYKTNFSKIGNYIKFKITDDMSDIQSYKAYIDGKFVLFSYDGKYDLISYKIEQKFKTGTTHLLKLEVFDEKNNKAVFETKFFK